MVYVMSIGARCYRGYIQECTHYPELVQPVCAPYIKVHSRKSSGGAPRPERRNHGLVNYDTGEEGTDEFGNLDNTDGLAHRAAL